MLKYGGKYVTSPPVKERRKQLGTDFQFKRQFTGSLGEKDFDLLVMNKGCSSNINFCSELCCL